MRYDYFLIWGNGLKYKNQILDEIRKDRNFQILMILHHRPKSIKKLVEAVYSYDYAPFRHLKSKTEYLLNTAPEAEFIFVKNTDPREDYAGEGSFRHIESQTVKILKEAIRDRYNERKDDRRTEDHVVHASDNQDQTDYILRYLGFDDGLNYLTREPNKLIKTKYYLEPFYRFTIRTIDINKVFCNILTGTRDSFSDSMMPLDKTPHFACLSGKPEIYQTYIEDFSGGPLTEDYSVDRFRDLSINFSYLDHNHPNDYIIVERIEPDKYCVLDGLHRAALLKYQGKNKVIAAVINE
jgi:hypothetical protein